MKKILIFGGVVLLLFVSLIVVNNAQQTKKAEGNPFGKTQLHPATLDLLNNENYQNIILPVELESQLSNEESVTVYFYSSTCQFCKETTPRLVPLADDAGINLVQYNLLEFEEGWNQYNIDATPTVVHFENGVEKERIVGAATDDDFKQFFDRVLN
ncbi:thioredoxin family protein [Halalkalibacter akibai]|uniref:Thioredoxin n=1 Tax=Halalkalibacter akibai (strain ATCC 43226 / DSM 21942 / CIP 109018 / JCM 9157 / 1139) TaxID=1236973 RepID=W4QT61_HALA3|nr:thioredoxin family protein [Halalkalibacter akibai]GAE34494.1 thioredoxin [Halalkalibacter akibai JCM 9157]